MNFDLESDDEKEKPPSKKVVVLPVAAVVKPKLIRKTVRELTRERLHKEIEDNKKTLLL